MALLYPEICFFAESSPDIHPTDDNRNLNRVNGTNLMNHEIFGPLGLFSAYHYKKFGCPKIGRGGLSSPLKYLPLQSQGHPLLF
jgi:hypothetical protein